MLAASVKTGTGTPGNGADLDEALSTRLRDLAFVEIDALVAGAADRAAMVAAFADDVADALHEARKRIAALRVSLGGADPLGVLDATVAQRGSEAGTSGADRVRARLFAHAEAARSLARLSDLAANLAPKLFEADRRR